MLIPEFRLRGYQDDETYQKMFQKEILEAGELGVDPENIGVPDIRTGGNYVVCTHKTKSPNSNKINPHSEKNFVMDAEISLLIQC